MKPGEVVTIRVNPRDCMAVADIVQSVGMNVQGMAFSQAVAIALSALLETMRASKAIPEREGFEYLEVMKPYVVKKRSGRKLDIAKFVVNIGDEHRVPALKVDDPAKARRRVRYEQLRLKKLGDDLNWTEAEQAELALLVDEFYQF